MRRCRVFFNLFFVSLVCFFPTSHCLITTEDSATYFCNTRDIAVIKLILTSEVVFLKLKSTEAIPGLLSVQQIKMSSSKSGSVFTTPLIFFLQTRYCMATKVSRFK